MTITNLHQSHIKHHEDRAQYWLSQGNPEYAAGSLAKAQRWRRKMREFDMFMNGPMPADRSWHIVHHYIRNARIALVEHIEDDLINKGSNDGFLGLLGRQQ